MGLLFRHFVLLLVAFPGAVLADGSRLEKSPEEKPRWGLLKYAGIKPTQTPVAKPSPTGPLRPLGQRSMKAFMLPE